MLWPPKFLHFCLARSWWQHICQGKGFDLNDFSILIAKGINKFFIVIQENITIKCGVCILLLLALLPLELSPSLGCFGDSG